LPRLYKCRANPVRCYGSPTESPRTGASASRNLHPAYKQTITRLPTGAQFKCHPRFPLSAPNGDQHRYDHDGSGGMRKSGHNVDDAGDASNTEIGHVAYLPSRTRYRYHTLCAILPNRAFSGEAGIWGRDSRGVPDGPSVRTAAGAMPNQTCVIGREPRPSPSGPAAGIAPKREGLSPRRVEKRHSLPSSLSR
jgi:hypothetical protein